MCLWWGTTKLSMHYNHRKHAQVVQLIGPTCTSLQINFFYPDHLAAETCAIYATLYLVQSIGPETLERPNLTSLCFNSAPYS